jgi:rod shape-determining protein MreB
MKFFKRKLAFDFGSSNTVVCENGNVIFDEPTMIASFHGPNESILIGNKALQAPQIGPCKFVRPILHGYVNDYAAFEAYVKAVVKKLVLFPRLCIKTVVIAIPNDMVGDENISDCERALLEPFRKLGVKDIRTIHNGVALYLDANKKNLK